MDLKKLVFKSELHKNIVTFFHENPASIDTPRGIAVWVRGELPKVKQALDDLSKEGVLIAHKVSSTTAYSYTRNEKIMDEIAEILGL